MVLRPHWHDSQSEAVSRGSGKRWWQLFGDEPGTEILVGRIFGDVDLRFKTSLSSARLTRTSLADERVKAVVLLATCGAAREMGAQPRHRRLGVFARELELDVAVEL